MVEKQVVEPSIKAAAESRAAITIREAFDSGRPVTYVRSSEEQRVARVLHDVARRMGFGMRAGTPLPVWTWSMTEGLVRDSSAAEPGTTDPRRALDFVIAHRDAGIFHLKDFHEPLRESAEDPAPPARCLRELPRPAEVRGDHFAGAIHSGRSWSAA